MSIRKLTLLAAISMLGLLAIGVTGASAHTSIRWDPTNSLLAADSTIMNGGSDPSTLVLDSGIGEINCSNTNFSATIPNATSATSVTGTLTSLTFTTCTDTLPVIAISSCHLANPAGTPPTVHITAISSNASTTVLNNTFVKCLITGGGGAGCFYRAATASGAGVNTPSSLTYSGVAVTHTVPAGGSGDQGALCGSTGSFSSKLTDITSVQGGTSRTITVTTN